MRSTRWRPRRAGRGCCRMGSRSTCSSPSPISAAIPNVSASTRPPRWSRPSTGWWCPSPITASRWTRSPIPPNSTFAARSTSSFPGAFPPFMVSELDEVIETRKMEWPGRADFLKRVLPRQFAANAAEMAVLIDGSVLANAPFRPAIEALRERPAQRQIDRRFVYIDPTPRVKIHFGTAHTRAARILPDDPRRDIRTPAPAADPRQSGRHRRALAPDRADADDHLEHPPRGGSTGRGAVRLHPVPRFADDLPARQLACPGAGRRRKKRGLWLCRLWPSEDRRGDRSDRVAPLSCGRGARPAAMEPDPRAYRRSGQRARLRRHEAELLGRRERDHDRIPALL